MGGQVAGCTHGTFLHPPCCHTRRPWATLWGHSRQQPLQGRSQGVLGACGGSLSPQDSTHMVGAGGSCTHGTFLTYPQVIGFFPLFSPFQALRS
jgi:hypothetical protein